MQRKYRDKFHYRNRTDRSLMPDEYNAIWAKKRIQQFAQEQTGQPWMMMVGFHKPHTPLYCPDEDFDAFPLEDIVLPPGAGNASIDEYYTGVMDRDKNRGYMEYDMLSSAYETPEMGYKKWTQAYYACVKFVDRQIGVVVDALEKSPFWDNTVVMLLSDNGWHNGQQKYFWKNSPWDAATRVPLIIRAPHVAEGSVSDKPVTLIDVYPTLIDLAGYGGEATIKSSAGRPLDGTSLKPILRGNADAWEGPEVAASLVYSWNKIYVQSRMQHADPTQHQLTAFDGRKRYIIYSTGQEELYDHETDPLEMNNYVHTEAGMQQKEPLKQALIKRLNLDPERLGTWYRPIICENWCFDHPSTWGSKCSWTDGDCADCPSCYR